MTYNQKRAVCAMFYLIAIFVGMFALYYIMTYYGSDIKTTPDSLIYAEEEIR